MVGALILGTMVMVDAAVHDTIRWDLFAVLGTMALTKLGAMLYFRLAD
jgi:hypothetical protein